MHNSFGMKIKNLACTLLVYNTLGSFFLSMYIYQIIPSFLASLVFFGIGIFITWIIYLLLYGFGELIDRDAP